MEDDPIKAHAARSREEAKRVARLCAAYRQLLGDDPRARNEDQRLVWEDLQRVGYQGQPVFVQDREGKLCPMKAAFADGRRSVFLYVQDCATRRPPVPPETLPATKTNR